MKSHLERFRETLADLVPPEATLILACSGGPDSQVMLDLMGKTLADGARYQVAVVGIDHGLRKEAEQELELARLLAQRHGIQFAAISVNVPTSGNLLENARNARYEAIRTYGQKHFDAPFILTGHSATDQCETMIQRFSRGTGLRGASSIHPLRADLVRPLLRFTRDEILNYANSNGIAFSEDPSNANRHRSRTVIREDMIPVLNTLNPEAQRHWVSFADQARRATEYLDHLAQPVRVAATGPLGSLRVSTLEKLEPYLRQWVIGQWLASHLLPVDSRYIEAVDQLITTPNKKLSVSGDLVLHEAGFLWGPVPATDFTQEIRAGEQLKIPKLGGYLQTSLIREKKSSFSPLNGPRQVAFDADQLHLELKIRPWRLGDRFHPFGLQGSVKVGDLFTNLKIPRPLREHWPVVVCGDVIIWVMGLRRGSMAPMSKETTSVYYMEYIGGLNPDDISTSMELDSE